jgi:hypothetical protein
VLLRLAYLAVTNAFAVLRLLPMSNLDKDVAGLPGTEGGALVVQRLWPVSKSRPS